jgi:hypothetical protein
MSFESSRVDQHVPLKLHDVACVFFHFFHGPPFEVPPMEYSMAARRAIGLWIDLSKKPVTWPYDQMKTGR